MFDLKTEAKILAQDHANADISTGQLIKGIISLVENYTENERSAASLKLKECQLGNQECLVKIIQLTDLLDKAEDIIRTWVPGETVLLKKIEKALMPPAVEDVRDV